MLNDAYTPVRRDYQVEATNEEGYNSGAVD